LARAAEGFRGLEDDAELAAVELSSSMVLSSASFLDFLVAGEGDRDEGIHDFRAKVANDPVRSFSWDVFFRSGTGETFGGGVICSCAAFLSGEPFTFCIQEIGLDTSDLLLPILSSCGLSSTGCPLLVTSAVYPDRLFCLVPGRSLLVTGGLLVEALRADRLPLVAAAGFSATGRYV
jgi:hypothetical protein